MKLKLTAVAIAVATILACATPGRDADPTPVISWPGDPTRSVAISWWAGTSNPVLELATPDGSTRKVTGGSTGGFATAEIHGLEQGTAYRYRIESGAWHEFTTMPSGQDAFSFAVLGDLQPFNTETDRTTSLVMRKVASLDPLFALQMGDLTETGISARSWRRALSVLGLLGSGTPLVMTAGNHDYYYGVPSARTFKSVFPAPYDDRSPRAHTWYSTAVGPVHIAVLDTESNGEDFDRQIDWLSGDLRRAREEGREWIFIAMHRPILATATGSEDQKWARALFPLIAANGVDAVFWGHDHLFEHYEYTYGANGLVLNEPDAAASRPVHMFTTGTAGARVDSLYRGFFTHRPFRETWDFYSIDTGRHEQLEFFQRPWNSERVFHDGEGIRFQSRDVYPDAGSYYSFPFASAEDESARRYSDDPQIRYSDDAEFFGYSYGESSIHYMWVEITSGRCVITAHYADGAAGEHGTIITTPEGRAMRWELSPRDRR